MDERTRLVGMIWAFRRVASRLKTSSLPQDLRSLVRAGIGADDRARAEETLREGEGRLAALLANVPAYVYRCVNEPGWPDVIASDYVSELTGYPKEDLLVGGKVKFSDLIVEEDRERIWEETRAAVARGERFRLRYTIRRKDGELRLVEEFGEGVYDENGNVEALEGIIHDVTEHGRTRKRLQETEERYRALVEQVPAVIYIDDADETNSVIYRSPHVEEILGYAPEEFFSDPEFWQNLLHPDDRERVLAENDRTNETGEPFRIEYRMIRKDGRVVWLRDEAILIRDGEGRPKFWQGVFMDITERKETEEKLQEAEARYRTLVEEVPAITYIYVQEPAGLSTTSYISPQIEAILGYTPEEYMKDPEFWKTVLHPDDRERVLAEDERTGQTGDEFRDEFRMIAKDGRMVWLREESRIVRREEDGTQVWHGVMFDITELKRVEEALKAAEGKYRTLVEQVPTVTYVQEIEHNNTAVYVSPQVEDLLGYSPEEFYADRDLWYGVVHPEDYERVMAEDVRTDETGEPYRDEYRMIHRDGHVVWVRDEAVLVEDSEGRPRFWHGTMFDITERKRIEEDLRLRNRAIEASSTGIIVTDAGEDNLIVYVNPAFERMTGYRAAEVLGRNPRFLQGSDRDQPGVRELRAALEEGREWAGTLRNYKKDGTLFYNEMHVSPVGDGEGRPTHWIGVQNDVTERKALEKQLAHQALHDPLTGLPNRALFMDRLEAALSRAERRGDKVAVLFLDLDDFKVINDSLGHEAGDRLLASVGQRLRELLRPGDTLARLGGDEFTVLLEGVRNEGEAAGIVERIARGLRAPFVLGGREIFITASIGFALDDTSDRSADLLRNADLAMYGAKYGGKARHEVFEEAMNARALERLELGTDLRRAVGRDEFVVHYQPEVELETGRFLGFEALVRWEHPERGLLLPDDFIPLAEETGLIVPIGQRVLEEACRKTREWHELYPSDPLLTISVNLSPRQFREPGLAGEVSRILRETGLPPHTLELEVTEGVLADDGRFVDSPLWELKDLGVRIAIDDFGTGYSSLNRLKHLPVNTLKIDRSFVGDLEEDPGDEVLVSGIVGLASGLGLKLVAEGVESAAQLERLREMGCEVAQGYHLAKPLGGEAATELLLTRLQRA